MEYVRNWWISYQQQAVSERAETAPLQTYKNNSTFIDKYKGSNQARLHWGFVKKKFQVSNKSLIHLIHRYINWWSVRCSISLLGNINCTDSGTYRKSHCASNLLLLTLYREISYHYSVVIPAGCCCCVLRERAVMSPLQIITWLLNTPDKDRSVGCFCWENLAPASYL